MALRAAAVYAAESSTIEFKGRVVSIVTLREHKGAAIQTHIDPRYAVTVDVLSANSESPPFRNGKRVVLAIHSPTRLFSVTADEILTGRNFNFAITQTANNGRTSYSALVARDP
jgi:hypothetical protein